MNPHCRGTEGIAAFANTGWNAKREPVRGQVGQSAPEARRPGPPVHHHHVEPAAEVVDRRDIGGEVESDLALLGRGNGRLFDRYRLDGRGYKRVYRQAVIAMHAQYDTASAPLPPYEQWLLGGDSLRGTRAGTAAGDKRLFGSVELRVPFSSPLSTGRVGFNVFMDAGVVVESVRVSVIVDRSYHRSFDGLLRGPDAAGVGRGVRASRVRARETPG